MKFLTALSALVVCSAGTVEYAFLSIGDWGARSAEHKVFMKANAASMTKFIQRHNNTGFVISTGDNFYDYGVTSTTSPEWKDAFEDIFDSPELQKLPWYATLGNHDYGYNPDAELNYTTSPLNTHKRWYLPARNYVKRVQLSPHHHLSLVVFDSNPCVKKYRAADPSGWDPKQPAKPDPNYKFHQNIVAEQCQYHKLASMLAAVSAGDWVVVVAHEPVNTINEFDINAMLDQYKVDLFINGHIHLLRHTVSASGRHHVTTGSGALTEKTANSTSPDLETTVWEKNTHGFTGHFFENSFTELHTHFYDSEGTGLYYFSQKKA